MIAFKRPSNTLAQMDRPVYSLSCRDSMRKRRILRSIDIAVQKIRPSPGRTGVLAFLLRQYYRTALVVTGSYQREGCKRQSRRNLTTSDFVVADYRFNREEVALMAVEFQLPYIVILDRNKFTGKEIIVIHCVD